MSIHDNLKKVLSARGMGWPNKLHVQSLKSSHYNNSEALRAVAFANEHNTDDFIVKLMAMVDSKMDEKVTRARKEILDMVDSRRETVRSSN